MFRHRPHPEDRALARFDLLMLAAMIATIALNVYALSRLTPR